MRGISSYDHDHGSAARRVFVATLAVAIVVSSVVGCRSTADAQATDGEAAVCTRLQAVMANLESDRRTDALTDFTALQALTAASGNETMVREGQALFEVLSAPVDNGEDLTIVESQQLGQEALTKSAGHLGALADECVRVDRPVELKNPSALR